MESLEEAKELLECGLISEEEFSWALEWFVSNCEAEDGESNEPGPSRRQPRRRAEFYGKFDLDKFTDEDVRLNFRFRREDIAVLQKTLLIPDEISIPGRGYRVQGKTALSILLRRLAYPNRLSDLERLFGLSGPALSTICTYLTKILMDRFGHLLDSLPAYINAGKLQYFAKAIHEKGAPLENCWGFIDGTARQMCRPSVDQENYFSGHKRYHCLKYQGILTPDGIIVSLKGSFPGRRHDAGIWVETRMEHTLRELCAAVGTKYVLYGDPAYPISDVLISPFVASSTAQNAAHFNEMMASVRQAVEWGFGKVTREFAFVDFSKNQKLLLQDLEGMYKLATILTNCHSILYGSQTASYFRVHPPALQEYLQPARR
ncbi:Hypothetical protein NTJ_13505 [Nesidiocoris tenuis]|uniref:DDE Tnp4 domain-containing protein n=1 Tax=Nesidiocoris tenuis TaxID=355587 RepID=A0ABN7B8V7_9HEMI|nr:Hypothetical protein NTJ_13505 [Nesidiocoris tenuis]